MLRDRKCLQAQHANRVFMITNVSLEERKILGKQIQKLGGVYKNDKNFYNSTTHVVCGESHRSEKLLSALVLGLWIVRPEYIYACEKAEKWLDESDFEWSGLDEVVSSVAKTNRLRAATGEKLFAEWHVAVNLSCFKRQQVYKRLLICGGARVLDIKLPMLNPYKYSENLTFLFVDKSTAPAAKCFQGLGVLCLDADYISDCIVLQPLPEPLNYILTCDEDDLQLNHSKIYSQSLLVTEETNKQTNTEGKKLLRTLSGKASSGHIDESKRGTSDHRTAEQEIFQTSAFASKCSEKVESTDASKQVPSVSMVSGNNDENNEFLFISQCLSGSEMSLVEYGSSRDSFSCRKSDSDLDVDSSQASRVNRKRSKGVRMVNVCCSKQAKKADKNTTSVSCKVLVGTINKQKHGPEVKQSNIPDHWIIEQEISQAGATASNCFEEGDSTDASKRAPSVSVVKAPLSRPNQPSSSLQRRGSSRESRKKSPSLAPADAPASVCFAFPKGMKMTPCLVNSSGDSKCPFCCQVDLTTATSALSTVSDRPKAPLLISPVVPPLSVKQAPNPDRKAKVQRSLHDWFFATGKENAVKVEVEKTTAPEAQAKKPRSSQRPKAVTERMSSYMLSVQRKRKSHDDESSVGSSCSPAQSPLPPKLSPKKRPKTIRGLAQKMTQKLNTDSTAHIENNAENKTLERITSNVVGSSCLPVQSPLSPKSSPRKRPKTIRGLAQKMTQELDSDLTAHVENKAENKTLEQITSNVEHHGHDDHSLPHLGKDFPVGGITSSTEVKICVSLNITPKKGDINQTPFDHQLSKPGTSSTPSHHQLSKPSTSSTPPPPDSAIQRQATPRWRVSGLSLQNQFDLVSCCESDLEKLGKVASAPDELVKCITAGIEEGDYLSAVDKALFLARYPPSPEAFSSTLKIIKESSDLGCAGQAFTILMGWLNKYPPVTPALRNLYETAFDLGHWETVSKIIEDAVVCGSDEAEKDHEPNAKPLLLLRLLVNALERNFVYFAHHPGKKHSCLMIRCLWAPAYTIYPNDKVRQLLLLLESSLKQLNSKQWCYSEILSLVAMAAQCCYLEDNHFKWDSNGQVDTASGDFAHDLAGTLRECGDKVLSLLSPPWLLRQVCAILLRDYDDYLVPGGLPQGPITLDMIVSKYFFLLPKLSSLEGSRSPKKRIDLQEKEKNESHAPLTKIQLTLDKINKKDGKGETILHKACKKNDLALAKQILSVAGVDINVQDNAGWTPLHEACYHGHVDVAKELLKYVPSSTIDKFFHSSKKCKRADLSLCSFAEGITPLHDAVSNNDISVVKLLIRYGGAALLGQNTSNGLTPMDLASTEEMRQVLCLETQDLDISLSQELGPEAQDYQKGVPTSFMYSAVVEGDDGSKMRATCEAATQFLKLLTLLLRSHLRATPEETAGFNIQYSCRCLRRHMKKITTNSDYQKLEFHLNLIEAWLTSCQKA